MITIELTRDAKLIALLNEDVQNLHAQWHPNLFKPHNQTAMEQSLVTMLADPNCFCYLALEENVPLGYALFFIREINENAFHYGFRKLYIDQICVLAEHRKAGIGKLLLQQAEKLASEKSITRIELDHWSSNTVAAAFFRKNGFELFKEQLVKIRTV